MALPPLLLLLQISSLPSRRRMQNMKAVASLFLLHTAVFTKGNTLPLRCRPPSKEQVKENRIGVNNLMNLYQSNFVTAVSWDTHIAKYRSIPWGCLTLLVEMGRNKALKKGIWGFWSTAGWLWASRAPWQPKWQTAPWGASGTALQPLEGRDQPALCWHGFTSSTVCGFGCHSLRKM